MRCMHGCVCLCVYDYVSEWMCVRGPCGLVQALGNWLCLCSRPFMDHRPLLAHFPAHKHTHTCAHTPMLTKFPAAPPQPLTPHHQHPDSIARKQGVKQERERSKGRRREQRQGNELTRPQEVEINKCVEWVGGSVGSLPADNKISFAWDSLHTTAPWRFF